VEKEGQMDLVRRRKKETKEIGWMEL